MGVLSFTTFCWEQARASTLSVFLPGEHVNVVLPGTRRFASSIIYACMIRLLLLLPVQLLKVTGNYLCKHSK